MVENISRLEVEGDVSRPAEMEEGKLISRSEVTGNVISKSEELETVSRSEMVGGELSRSTVLEEEEEATESDSDAHVSSVLLTGHPDITISEPSDDEFYS